MRNRHVRGLRTPLWGQAKRLMQTLRMAIPAIVLLLALPLSSTAAPSTFMVTFDCNSGTPATTPYQQEFTASVQEPLDPEGCTFAGRTFGGWATSDVRADNQNISYVDGQPVTFTTSRTLYAIWLGSFTVTFDVNNGTSAVPPPPQTEDQNNVPLTSNTSLGISRVGFTFAGWNTEADGVGGTAYADVSNFDFIEQGDTTLFAQWEATITFDKNDESATGTMPNQTESTNTALDPENFTLTNYTFSGWATEAGGGGTTYADGANYNFPVDGADTLYAQWTASTYTITYDANDGTLGGGEDTSYTYGDAAITAPTDPTRTGYDFDGWFTDDITFASSAFPLTPTGDTTVYAKWTAATYTITYDANSGTLAGTEDTSYTTGDAAISQPTDPTRTGYAFVDWYSDALFATVATWPLTPTEDTTVYAKWVATATYTVDYDSNGGSATPAQDSSTDGASVTLPSPGSRSGYSFSGWYDNEGLTGSEVGDAGDPYVPTGDVTLYAKWTSTGGGGGGGGGTSAPTNLSTPFLTGYTSVGSTITASPGTWTTATSFVYEWYRCTTASSITQVELPADCTFITSDVGPTYIIQAADLGAWIRVQVRAQAGAATTSLFSATTAVVGPKPASIKARPPRVTNGLAAVGSTLAAKRGQWNNVGATYSYQWYRCTKFGLKNPKGVPATCTAITGAASKTYTVKAADRGFYLRVRVTATGPTGQGFRMSQSTGYVPN